ncbi:small ribosomal subunit protein uS7-like [Topomyia yanbarensis]|uniref:small ribosomal subunit protein uS7-like n=1 Tax=Topomyia yanbarensis TaxID=2498891 RepID=UPI00273BF30A|nr:small ribosomal subunit protein uS7-like [Topomyia yanbarensis]
MVFNQAQFVRGTPRHQAVRSLDTHISDISVSDYIAVKEKHTKNHVKKLEAVRVEIMHLLTEENPLQIAVQSIINLGSRKYSTRIGRAGTARRQAVNVSTLRCVNQAIWLLCTGAREAAFRKI